MKIGDSEQTVGALEQRSRHAGGTWGT